MFPISIQHTWREVAVRSYYTEISDKFNAEFSQINLKAILKSFDKHLPPNEIKKLTDTINLLSGPSDNDRMKRAAVRYFYHHHQSNEIIMMIRTELLFFFSDSIRSNRLRIKIEIK